MTQPSHTTGLSSGETTPFLHGHPLPAQIYTQLMQSGMSREQISDLCDAATHGITGYKEFFGLTPDTILAAETMALELYRRNEMGSAALVYTFLLDIDATHATAWRGLGAARLAEGSIDRALIALDAAVLADPSDPIARFLLGEALLASRRTIEAKAMLESALEMAGNNPGFSTYVRRAQVLLKAHDLHEQLPSASWTMSSHVPTRSRDVLNPDLPAGRLPTPEEAQHMTMADIERHKPTHELARKLCEAVGNHTITLKDVAGFSDDQLVPLYNAGCQQLAMGHPTEALQTAGWLIFWDSRNHRHYLLAGVATQQLQLFCLADYFLGLALIYAPNDPTTMLYRGEVKIFSNEVEDGLALIRSALPRLPNDAFSQSLRRRGIILIKQHETQSEQSP